jgi:hypothetical protein
MADRTSLGGGLFFIAPTIPDSVMFIRAIIHMLGDQPGLRAMQIKFTSFGPESVFHPFFEAAERRITSAIMTQKLATQIQILQLLFPTNVVEIREEYEFKRLFGAANRPGIIHMDMPGRQQQSEPHQLEVVQPLFSTYLIQTRRAMLMGTISAIESCP